MTFGIEVLRPPVDLVSSAVAVPEIIGIRSAEFSCVPVSIVVTVAPRIESLGDDQKQIEYVADDSERDVATKLTDVAKEVGDCRLQPDLVT